MTMDPQQNQKIHFFALAVKTWSLLSSFPRASTVLPGPQVLSLSYFHPSQMISATWFCGNTQDSEIKGCCCKGRYPVHCYILLLYHDTLHQYCDPKLWIQISLEFSSFLLPSESCCITRFFSDSSPFHFFRISKKDSLRAESETMMKPVDTMFPKSIRQDHQKICCTFTTYGCDLSTFTRMDDIGPDNPTSENVSVVSSHGGKEDDCYLGIQYSINSK